MAESQFIVGDLHGHWVGDHSDCDPRSTCRTGPVITDESLACGDCYDIAHDEMDERETCDLHAPEPDAVAERTIEVKVRPRLDAVTVRPGDKLVVRVRSSMTLADVAEWKAKLAELLPGVEAVFIGAEQLLVYRPDGDGDD